MNLKFLNLFLVLVFSSVFSLSILGETLSPGPDACGGFIILKGTFELTYKVYSLNTTNETGSTCVWVIRAPSGSIGFNLTRLDLDSKGASSGVSGILSIQQGIQSQQNFTTSRVIEDGDLDKEIIVNETWTILVFRHFSSDSRIQGKGFQMRLRPVPRKILTNDFVGIHADFLGGQMAKMNDSRFVFPKLYGQPLVIVVNSCHRKSLQVEAWTLFMDKNEFANFYQFSKQQNKFVFMTKLEYMFGSTEHYGTLKADEDQPILFYYHTKNSVLDSRVVGKKGMLRLYYSYKNLTYVTSNFPMDTTTTLSPVTITPTGILSTTVKNNVSETSTSHVMNNNTILQWVGLSIGLLMAFTSLYCVFFKNLTNRNFQWVVGRNLSGSSINYTPSPNKKMEKISLAEEVVVRNI